MGAPATFAQTFGIQTINVNISARRNNTAFDNIRDGNSDIVTSAARGSQGVYTFTLAKKLTRMIDGIAQVSSPASPVTAGSAAYAKLFIIEAPDAADVDVVHALIDTTAITNTTTGFTNPDVPRNLTVTKSASWDGGTVTVEGTDQYDNAISEVFPDLTDGIEVGEKIFKTVTASRHSIALAGGNGYSIGVGDKLGVVGDIAAAEGVLLVDGVFEAATVDATYDGFTPTTVPDAAVTYQFTANVAAGVGVTCQCDYDESTGVITVYCLGPDGLTDPTDLSRINFSGTFSYLSSQKDPA